MQTIHITATSCVHPAAFAAALRSELLAHEPDADLAIRVISAPASRRFQMVSAPEPCLSELITDLVEQVRDDLEDAEYGHGEGVPNVACEIDIEQVPGALKAGAIVHGFVVDGRMQLIAVPA